MFNVVLYQPEIPANTGNIGRTCVVTGARLHLIGPLGFSLDHKTVHRAGLGYWENLDVRTYESWEGFLRQNGLATDDERLHLLTKKARRTYAQSNYRDGDYLVFGSESTGIPEELLAQHRLPTPKPGKRTSRHLGTASPITKRSCSRISAAILSTPQTIASAHSTSPTPPPSSSTRHYARRTFPGCSAAA